MGTSNGPYREEFLAGSRVRIRDRSALDAFRAEWRWHHPIVPEQLSFAGQQATVRSVAFYHGGDEIYELEGIPGVWHEQCLERT
jgi:hypothetical protein